VQLLICYITYSKLWHGQLTDRVVHIVKLLDQAVRVRAFACIYHA
jgi:hypothetical protein